MDEIPEMMWVHVDTMRLLESLYDLDAIQKILADMWNDEGGAWCSMLIVSFNDPPVLDYIETNVVRRYNWRLN